MTYRWLVRGWFARKRICCTQFGDVSSVNITRLEFPFMISATLTDAVILELKHLNNVQYGTEVFKPARKMKNVCDLNM